MNEIFQFLRFQEFMYELREICFPLGKMEYCTHLKFCAYRGISDLKKGPVNTFTPSPPNIKDYLCCKNIFSIK